MKCTVFDFDDTLMATRERRISALILAASHFGLKITPEQIVPHWGKPFDELISNSIIGVDYQDFHQHYAQVMRTIEPRVLPGALELLSMLYEHQLPVFVISSGSVTLVRQDLEAAGLWRYVTRLWGFESTKYHKPDPRVLSPVLEAMAESGMRVSDAVYLADSTLDYRVARAIGVEFYGVLTGLTTRVEFETAGLPATFILESLAEFQDLAQFSCT